MNGVSCDHMHVPPLVCFVFFPGVFLSSRVTGACPVTTDLIMRVNVRTTTTTTTDRKTQELGYKPGSPNQVLVAHSKS